MEQGSEVEERGEAVYDEGAPSPSVSDCGSAATPRGSTSWGSAEAEEAEAEAGTARRKEAAEAGGGCVQEVVKGWDVEEAQAQEEGGAGRQVEVVEQAQEGTGERVEACGREEAAARHGGQQVRTRGGTSRSISTRGVDDSR